MHTQSPIKHSILIVIALSSLLLTNANAEDEITSVTYESIVFLYESRAEVRIPDDQLAKRVSTDYRQARDEFIRHDILQEIKPVLERRLNEASQIEKVSLKIKGWLGEYNFETLSFPTEFSDITKVAFVRPYVVTFINGSDMGVVPVPLKEARSLRGQMQKGDMAFFTVTGEVVGVKKMSIGGIDDLKVVQLKVTQIELDSRSDGHIRTFETYPDSRYW